MELWHGWLHKPSCLVQKPAGVENSRVCAPDLKKTNTRKWLAGRGIGIVKGVLLPYLGVTRYGPVCPQDIVAALDLDSGESVLWDGGEYIVFEGKSGVLWDTGPKTQGLIKYGHVDGVPLCIVGKKRRIML